MLLSPSNRSYLSYPLLSYFSVVVCLRYLLHHILLLISGKLGFVFIIIVQFMMSTNNRIRFGLQIVFVCLYITPSQYHHCANWSEDIELIDGCQIYFIECVSKIKHILSVIHYTICGAACFQFTHVPCDDWDKIYIYIYTLSYRHQIGSMNYYRLLRVRSWNNAMRCMLLYSLILDHNTIWTS